MTLRKCKLSFPLIKCGLIMNLSKKTLANLKLIDSERILCNRFMV